MKTQRAFFGILVTLFCILFLTGCSEATTMYDTGITNQQEFNNYDKWQTENEVRLVLGINVVGDEEQDTSGIEVLKDFKISNKHLKKIENLQQGIISFFQERYQVDVSDKIGKQEIVVYDSFGANADTYGYVDPINQNILNLNRKIFKEDADKFANTYIHETLHQIGFISTETNLIDEGITDALTDMVCCYMGINSVVTEYYFESRTIAYQLLKADPEIVAAYLTEKDFNIKNRISDKLANVSMNHEKDDRLGEFLNYMLKAMYDLNTGIVFDYGFDPYLFAFQAQEIAKAYCQECKPDAETIDYIRAHYLSIDNEFIAVKEDEYGYYFE